MPQVQGVARRSRHVVPASQPRQPQPTVYQVSVAYTQKNHPLRRNSKVRKDVGWTELYQEQGEALEFFLGLVKASSIGTLTCENVQFADRFFYVSTRRQQCTTIRLVTKTDLSPDFPEF